MTGGGRVIRERDESTHQIPDGLRRGWQSRADSWQFEKMTRGTRDGQLATSSFWGVPEQRGQ